MKKLFIITTILLLKTFPSLGAVGDVYICKPIQIFTTHYEDKKMYQVLPENMHKSQNFDEEYTVRLVWMEKSISIRIVKYKSFGYDIPFNYHSSKGNTELFLAQESGRIASFKNGLLTVADLNHTVLEEQKFERYNCKKV